MRYAKSIGSEGRIAAGHPHRVGRYRHAMEQVRMQPELGRCQRHATGESMPVAPKLLNVCNLRAVNGMRQERACQAATHPACRHASPVR